MDANSGDVTRLDDELSTPTERVIRTMERLEGDLLVLGAGGKMGPTLTRMAHRASQAAGTTRRVIAVSRFREAGLRDRLHSWGVETAECDLLSEAAIADLPEAPNVIFMTGLKFGASANPALTWAMNCFVPVLVSRKFRGSRIAVFSSGNVYGPTPVDRGGSVETDTPAPVGEYAMSVLGRERMFEYCSREWSIPVVHLRLNYATELRYGVLVDIGRQVLTEAPLDLTTGWVNVIWQSEANAMALESLLQATSPPTILNIAGAEILRVREVAEKFARLLGKPVKFTGAEASDALLSNASASYELWGRPGITADQMIEWTAEWLQAGGEYSGKPTHFESRDGRF